MLKDYRTRHMLTDSHYYFKLGKTTTNMQGYIGLQAYIQNIEFLLVISEAVQRNRHNVVHNCPQCISVPFRKIIYGRRLVLLPQI